ncbi:hypothetical protein SAMN05660686_01119 [Thalassobaculum litoreum DSM 18839]|uniref:Uncharacterized protein n=1 Tax=Thalassobaculum litoreum DSM 18839 TaxID=1123362 RepID=A0A8G2EXW5_9PROT|nr:hypothetical protein SAMN05660686_01119 [Thalassobaculum litoreum DSM 18839]
MATWLGAPLALGALGWEILEGGGMPAIGTVAAVAVVVAYTVALLRIHDLTGEWTFF